MKQIVAVLFVFILVSTSCLPLIEPITMDDTPTTLNINKDIVLPAGTTVDGVDISTIAGAAHAQNTDTNMGVLAVKPLALDADKFVIRDSAAADVFSTTTGAQLKTYLGTHAQNTDWTLKDSAGGASLIHNGYFVSDMRTDRWMANDSNTFFGVDVAGSDHLTDAGGGSEATGNTGIGNMSLRSITSGYYNTAVGNMAQTGITTGIGNTSLGENSLSTISTQCFNTAIGTDSLWQNLGQYNVAVGMNSGSANTGSSNVFLGYAAGQNELGSNKLYIDNSNDTTPLIYGDFSTDAVTINEDLIVADDTEIVGTLNLSGDAIIKTDKTSARDLTITTGAVKTLVLDTPVYDDMTVSMANAKTPAANAPNWVAYKGSEIPAFSKSATNVLYFTAQLPHTYKEGTNLEFHIHITYPDTGAGNSVWYFTYSWANIDGAFPGASNSGNIVVPTHSTADFHDMAQIVTTINGAGKTVSSILLCSISRIGGDGSDDYDNVVYLVAGDFHYQKDTWGSRQQLVK